MDECYRDHAIELNRTACWSAVITEISTGTILPTKVTALPEEGRGVALRRARELIDIYSGFNMRPPLHHA